MERRWLTAALLALAASAWAAPALARGEDAAKLLEGVKTVARPGVPGPVVVFGETAFAVVEGAAGGVRAGAIAAGRSGSGRIVVFGHNGFMAAETAKVGDTLALARNLAAWASKSKAKSLRVGAHGKSFAGLFGALGFEVVELPRGAKPNGADKLDLIGCAPLSLSAEESTWMAEYVQRGGALFCGDTPWGWQQLHPKLKIASQAGQQLLARAGLAYADGYLEATSEDGAFVARAPDELLNAWKALDLLVDTESGKRAATREQSQQAEATLRLALKWMPAGDYDLRERLAKLVREREADLAPTEARPIGPDAALTRALVSVQQSLFDDTPMNKRKAHACAADFPGSVDGPPIVQAVEIDCTRSGWRSTGLYAAPGARVEFVLPTDAVGRGLAAQIGAHTDELWRLDEWKRHPQITLHAPLEDKSTTIVSPFGGPIYIDVPRGFVLPKVKLQIRGAVAAPRFVLGETTLDEWRSKERSKPAPWAEIESNKLALTVPSRVVRELDDPQALMEFWDRVLDAMADVAAIGRERDRPERIVCDRQISAGYMHSGYPIMTHLDVAETVVDRARLAAGDGLWGFVHELGHNHQRPEWTFEGTGEVTNNVLALYVIEKVCQLPAGQHGHEAVDHPPSVDEYRARGASFAEWKDKPFLALQMYVELRNAFGWEPFVKTFAEYQTLGQYEKPQSDDEKRDQWLVRLSHNCNANLGPFFQAWGVPTSEKARRAVEVLPEWKR